MGAKVLEDDLALRLQNAKRYFHKFYSRNLSFLEMIGMEDEEFNMIINGEILLAPEYADSLIDLGFDADWVMGEGDPRAPIFNNRRGR